MDRGPPLSPRDLETLEGALRAGRGFTHGCDPPNVSTCWHLLGTVQAEAANLAPEFPMSRVRAVAGDLHF